MTVIPKHPGGQKGTWWWHEGARTPTVSCPGCQALGGLDHAVAADGAVTPFLQCPKGCGFHDMVRLMEWDRGPADFHR